LIMLVSVMFFASVGCGLSNEDIRQTETSFASEAKKTQAVNERAKYLDCLSSQHEAVRLIDEKRESCPNYDCRTGLSLSIRAIAESISTTCERPYACSEIVEESFTRILYHTASLLEIPDPDLTVYENDQQGQYFFEEWIFSQDRYLYHRRNSCSRGIQ